MSMNSSDNNSNGNRNDDERSEIVPEVLNGHESHCMINFRMSSIVFRSLLRVLETLYDLQSSRNISSLEILDIFLHMLGVGAKISQCREIS
ncbi:hypothetical protein Gohar_013045, partial [Gossypium harknessii]|nr:hypothetical protein [Gossypium harknessii]